MPTDNHAGQQEPARAGTPVPSTREFFAATRAELRQAFDDARGRLQAGSPRLQSRARARAALDEVRGRVRARMGVPAPPPPPAAGALSIPDLHGLERVLSHLRHSVVRICFYNLKLFCPSLADEYDAHVRAQVLANIDKMGLVHDEFEGFFQEPFAGTTSGGLFPSARREVDAALRELRRRCEFVRDKLDEEPARLEFARTAPDCIDRIMRALETVQAELDARKLAPVELAEEALALHQPLLDEAGIKAALDAAATPRVFGEHAALLGALGEVISNAVKHARANALLVTVRTGEDRLHVEIAIADNGQGMPPDRVAACTQRGASTGGSGEGLAMVREIIEAEHLGALSIESIEGAGTTVCLTLPVKFQPGAPTA